MQNEPFNTYRQVIALAAGLLLHGVLVADGIYVAPYEETIDDQLNHPVYGPETYGFTMNWNDFSGGDSTSVWNYNLNYSTTYGVWQDLFMRIWDDYGVGTESWYINGSFDSIIPHNGPLPFYYEHCAVSYSQGSPGYEYQYSRTADATMKLLADSLATPEFEWIYRITSNLTEYNDPLWSSPSEPWGYIPVNSNGTNISVAGKNVDEEDNVYLNVGAPSLTDVTPSYSDNYYYYSQSAHRYPIGVFISGDEDGTGFLNALSASYFASVPVYAKGKFESMGYDADYFNDPDWGFPGTNDGHPKILPFYQVFEIMCHGSEKDQNGIAIIDDLLMSNIAGLKNEVPTGNSYRLVILHACNSSNYPFQSSFGAQVMIGWNYYVNAIHVSDYDYYFWDRITSEISTSASNLYAATMTAAWTLLDHATAVHSGTSFVIYDNN